jgi:hypothetical protein
VRCGGEEAEGAWELTDLKTGWSGVPPVRSSMNMYARHAQHRPKPTLAEG